MFNRIINTNKKKKYIQTTIFYEILYIFRSIKNHFNNIFNKKLKRKIHKESYWSVSNFSRIDKRKKKISQHPLLLETNKNIYIFLSIYFKKSCKLVFINGNQRNLFFFPIREKQTILSRTQ